MATPVLAPIVGAPYCPGDPVWVEVQGIWARGVVIHRHAPLTTAPFGLRWAITLDVDGEPMTVRVDDNGRNHTWRHQVCPR